MFQNKSRILKTHVRNRRITDSKSQQDLRLADGRVEQIETSRRVKICFQEGIDLRYQKGTSCVVARHQVNPKAFCRLPLPMITNYHLFEQMALTLYFTFLTCQCICILFGMRKQMTTTSLTLIPKTFLSKKPSILWTGEVKYKFGNEIPRSQHQSDWQNQPLSL